MSNRLNKLSVFFVVIETLVLVNLFQSLAEKTLLENLLYIFLYTVFSCEMSYVLYTLYFEDAITDWKRLDKKMFVFSSEKKFVKLFALLLALFLFVLSMVFDRSYIVFALLILSGSFIATTRIFFIENNEILFADNYLNQPYFVKKARFDKIKRVFNITLSNDNEISFKVQERMLSQAIELSELTQQFHCL